jgi:galactonate dehydratase
MPDRRSFLRRASAALPAAALAPHAWTDSPLADTPAGQRLRGVRSELGAHLKQARVREVNVYPLRRLSLVQVVADDGTQGWGEAGHSGGELVLHVVRDQIADLVVGQDVFDADPVWHRVFFEIDELGPGGLASQALAGVDCALWDLRGKLLGVPVYQLLGGAFRREIPLYGSFSRSLGGSRRMTPAQAAEKAAELVDEGFKALKVRMAIREEGVDPDPDPSWAVLDAVRAAIGDAFPLYVDANNGYTPGVAIRAARRLREDYGAEVFEEPLSPYHYKELGRVNDATEILIAGGEHEYTKWAFRDLILDGKADILNPDLSKLAGITEGMKVAALSEVFERPISVHNARPTLLTAAHAHFVAAVRMAYRTQEHPGNRRLSHLWDYFQNRLAHENGILRVPETPGLGLTPDLAAIRAAAD